MESNCNDNNVLVRCQTKGHKTKCNKIKDDRKRLYMLVFNQLGRN